MCRMKYMKKKTQKVIKQVKIVGFFLKGMNFNVYFNVNFCILFIYL